MNILYKCVISPASKLLHLYLASNAWNVRKAEEMTSAASQSASCKKDLISIQELHSVVRLFMFTYVYYLT